MEKIKEINKINSSINDITLHTDFLIEKLPDYFPVIKEKIRTRKNKRNIINNRVVSSRINGIKNSNRKICLGLDNIPDTKIIKENSNSGITRQINSLKSNEFIVIDSTGKSFIIIKEKLKIQDQEKKNPENVFIQAKLPAYEITSNFGNFPVSGKINLGIEKQKKVSIDNAGEYSAWKVLLGLEQYKKIELSHNMAGEKSTKMFLESGEIITFDKNDNPVKLEYKNKVKFY